MAAFRQARGLPRRRCLSVAVALLLTREAAVAHTEERVSAVKAPVVAVLNFDYAGKDAALEPLAHGLAQMLISDLTSLASIQVVERARLQSLLQEQKLVKGGAVDVRTAARVGKLLGARYLVLGSYFDLMKQIRLDARLVEVETGKVIASVGQTGAVDDFWTLEASLAGKLQESLVAALSNLGAARTPSEKPVKPRAKLNARSVALYGKALASLDKGNRQAAQALLQQTVAENPKFSLAAADLDGLLR